MRKVDREIPEFIFGYKNFICFLVMVTVACINSFICLYIDHRLWIVDAYLGVQFTDMGTLLEPNTIVLTVVSLDLLISFY